MGDSGSIPIIDVFAGPGGLGEGFSAFVRAGRSARFNIALSIEMEYWAHQTLLLRSFFHQFPVGEVPREYYCHLRGEIPRDELFRKFAKAAAAAEKQAWRAELGTVDPEEVDRRIRLALQSCDQWVLCGGPPCQAFSVVGRSRNGGISRKDHRVYLYRQYLRILSVHEPPVFIMENVKGLLSSHVGGNEIFQQMLDDLRHPGAVAETERKGGARYSLYSFTASEGAKTDPGYEPRDFVLKCEDFGVPQTRHRVVILGVREDVTRPVMPTLESHGRCISARAVLRGLPRLRSGLSRTEDGHEEWRTALNSILTADFMRSRRNGQGGQVRERMLETLGTTRGFRADRGAEFIPCRPDTDYRPDWFLDAAIGGVCNHASRFHMISDLHRYLFSASYARVHGRSPELGDFPAELHPDHKNLRAALKKGHFDDRFRVQMSGRPATTITSHIAKDGHYFIHYDETQCRSLTVREAARLQTFPDNYYFCGPRTHQYRQVGNAVPPLLANQIASLVARILNRTEGRASGTQAAALACRKAAAGRG
jgi:DNA (cytosine-5)-methyltransferase 1